MINFMAFKHYAKPMNWIGFILFIVGIILILLRIWDYGFALLATGAIIIFAYLELTKKDFHSYKEGYNRRSGELDAENDFRRR